MNWRIFSALIILGLFTSCLNQSADSGILSQRYLHKYGFEVSRNEWEERKGDGQIVTSFADGSEQVCSYKGSVLHGPSTLSYPKSRALKEKSDYDEGVLCKKTFFNLQGLPMREELYDQDKTTITVWDGKGVPLATEEYREGYLVNGRYFTPLNKLESSVADGSGVRIKRNEEGRLLYKEQFKDGQLAVRTTFHPNGSIETVSNFQDYQLHGGQKTFSPTGSLIREAFWQNGLLHGKEICYRGGSKFLEVPYCNGKKDGVEKEYYQGHLVREVPWAQGFKHGMERTRYRDYTDVHWYFNGKNVDLAKYRQLKEREKMMADLEKSKEMLDRLQTN